MKIALYRSVDGATGNLIFKVTDYQEDTDNGWFRVSDIIEVEFTMLDNITEDMRAIAIVIAKAGVEKAEAALAKARQV